MPMLSTVFENVLTNLTISTANFFNENGTVTRVGANLVQSLVNLNAASTDSGPAALTNAPRLAPPAAPP